MAEIRQEKQEELGATGTLIRSLPACLSVCVCVVAW